MYGALAGASRLPRKKKGVIQTVLVPKNRFTKEQAIQWIESHGYKNKKIDETKAYYRFRQQEPNKKGVYYTVFLPNWVHLVYSK